jgi:hypothetical protein
MREHQCKSARLLGDEKEKEIRSRHQEKQKTFLSSCFSFQIARLNIGPAHY